MNILTIKRSALLLSLGIAMGVAYGGEEPYPANPVNMQFFRNETVPNVGIIVDNTSTMTTRVNRRHNVLPDGSENFRRAPRRLDVVKDAALNIINRYSDQFNWALFVINDGYRDMHWDYSNDKSGSGFVEVSTIDKNATYANPFSSGGSPRLVYATGQRSNKDPVDFNTFKTYSYVENGVRKTIRDLVGVDMNEQSFATLTDRFGRLYNDISTKSYSYINKNGNTISASSTSRSWGNARGHQVLVPLGNHLDPNFDSEAHKKQMVVGLRSIAPVTGYLQYVYGQAMEYMADHVDYRCQDSFMIVLTDGNTITTSYNKRAAEKYAHHLHPRSSNERDKDGQFFNGEDFPNQHIRSYAIGIGTNKTKFQKFEGYGKGRAVTANDAEEILELMEEFVEDMRPSNRFHTITPATSYIANDQNTVLQGEIVTNGNDWSSTLNFRQLDNSITGLKARYFVKDIKTTIDDFKDDRGRLSKQAQKDYEAFLEENAKAEKYEAVVYANTPTGLKNYSELSKTDPFISWLIGGRIADQSTDKYRKRTVQIDGEKRFLGDTFSDMFDMLGEIDPVIQAPKFLALGSNDGVFKLYAPNPLYGEMYEEEDDDGNKEWVVDRNPYAYTFGYIPGAALKNNGKNILETMAIRADKDYGKQSLTAPEHQYTMNGSMMYRTTDQGQTFIVATLGQGGRGAFALNVGGRDHRDPNKRVGLDADQAQWGRSVPLWDTSRNAPGFAHNESKTVYRDLDTRKMGYITGSPSIARIALERKGGIPNLEGDVRYIAAIPTGNHGDDDGPTLYLHDALGINVAINALQKSQEPKAGELLKKITYHDSSLRYQSSLSGVSLVDLDFDGVVDVGYAGDRNGNLYRFDFRGDTPHDWSVHLLYEGDPSQPIKYTPAVSRFGGRTVVVFGTGSQVYREDYDNPPQQAVYGIIDQLMDQKTYRKEDLIEQTMSDNYPDNGQERADIRYVTSHKVGNNDAGWFINLAHAEGESIFGPVDIVYGTAFFRTHVVDNDDEPENDWKCFRSMTGPSSWVMQVNALNGGLVTEDDAYLNTLGPDIAGMRIDGFVSSGKVVTIGKSSSMSFDGVAQSGSDNDLALDPSKSSEKPRNPIYKSHERDESIEGLQDGDVIVTGDGGGTINLPKGGRRELSPVRMYIRTVF